MPTAPFPNPTVRNYDSKDTLQPCLLRQVYVLQFFLVREVGAVQQMAVDYLTPIVGVVEGALFRCNFCDISALRLALVCGRPLRSWSSDTKSLAIA